MDKKKGIIVLLIAVAILYFGGCLTSDAPAHGEDDHACAVECHDNADHECADGCADWVDPKKLVNRDDTQNQIIETLRKTPLFYAKAKEFKFHLDNKSGSFSIISVVISTDMSTDTSRQRTCDEISKSIAGEKIVFNSGEESQSSEETTEVYRLKQKGEITLGENKFSADFYFNGKSNENLTSFHGKIIFAMPSIESLNGEKVIIEVKDKK